MFYLSSFPAPLGMRCACLFAIFSLSASLDKRCSMSLSYCAPLGMIYVLADLQSFLFLPLWTGDVLSLLILTASGCIMNLLIEFFSYLASICSISPHLLPLLGMRHSCLFAIFSLIVSSNLNEICTCYPHSHCKASFIAPIGR